MVRSIAVDFDGCLCVDRFPDIGAENELAIRNLLHMQSEGYKIILWTCRCGQLLDAAVEWCRQRGLIFDAVNENLPEYIEHFGDDCRKVYATEYWDDKAVQIKAARR